MRKAARVFIIIGMIFQFYFVFPIIIGAVALKRINTAKTKDELVGIGVATIILVSILGGIFLLNIPQSELDQSNLNLNSENETKDDSQVMLFENKEVESIVENPLEYINRIKDLKKLYDSGALTKEEFEELKAEQLDL